MQDSRFKGYQQHSRRRKKSFIKAKTGYEERSREMDRVTAHTHEITQVQAHGSTNYQERGANNKRERKRGVEGGSEAIKNGREDVCKRNIETKETSTSRRRLVDLHPPRVPGLDPSSLALPLLESDILRVLVLVSDRASSGRASPVDLRRRVGRHGSVRRRMLIGRHRRTKRRRFRVLGGCE